ncbi:MAG: tetratricopeptide repeat protein [Planctomycetaceae bacterium]
MLHSGAFNHDNRYGRYFVHGTQNRTETLCARRFERGFDMTNVDVREYRSMQTVPQALQAAIHHHRGGELKQAENLYRHILRVDPRHADALHLLGLVAYQESKPVEAIDLLKRAIKANGSVGRYHCHLGAAYRAAGDVAAAVDSYRRSISLDPRSVDAHFNLGNALRQQGEWRRAVDSYQTALRHDPRHLQARYNLGNTWKELLQYDDAIAEYEQALSIDPNFVEAINNLASVYHDVGDAAEAQRLYERCISIHPRHSRAWNNLGNVHFSQERFADATNCFLEALKIDPHYVEALYNLAAVYKENGDLAQAADFYRRCLAMKPDYADAQNNLGTVLQMGDRLDEALATYEAVLASHPEHTQALYNRGNVLIDLLRLDEAGACNRVLLERDPSHNAARFDRGLIDLLTGNWLAGWEGYEHRWCQDSAQLREFPVPEWDGRRHPQTRLFVSAEQGVGDEVMFASCLPHVAPLVKSVVLECDRRLIPLFRRSFPFLELISRPVDLAHEPNPVIERADRHIPLGSLPRVCQWTPETVPPQRGYLRADERRVAHWRSRLAPLSDGMKIGVSWRGGKAFRKQLRRSAPLERWNQVLSLEGAAFIDVQYGPTDDDRRQLCDRHQLHLHHFPEIDPLRDLDEFAAMVASLDLVISIDNSTVHLAGALDVPTWAMLPYSTDWRWMIDRRTSPWYPSVQLFRQQKPGVWDEPLAEIHNTLRTKLEIED